MQSWVSHSERETEQLAERFAASLSPGSVLAFEGGLGAGKTAFVRGLARGLGCSDRVSSPTFTIAHEYGGGRLALFHFDMYRITSFSELYSTGFFEYLERGGVCAVEWSEQIYGALPDNTVFITIEPLENPNERRITVREGGAS